MPIGVSRGGIVQRIWTPLKLPSLVAWYDAYNVQTVAGPKVSQLDDRSGNGNHATQATDADRPDYVANDGNGRPGVDFDTNAGVSEFLNTPDFFSGSSNRSVFAIINPRQDGNAHYYSAGPNNTGQRWSFKTNDGDDALRIELQGSGFSSSLVPSGVADNFMGCVLNGTTQADHTLYLGNSSEVATGTASVDTQAGFSMIGSRDGISDDPAPTALGTLREMVICTTDLSSGEIDDLRAYLSQKWALGL